MNFIISPWSGDGVSIDIPIRDTSLYGIVRIFHTSGNDHMLVIWNHSVLDPSIDGIEYDSDGKCVLIGVDDI